MSESDSILPMSLCTSFRILSHAWDLSLLKTPEKIGYVQESISGKTPAFRKYICSDLFLASRTRVVNLA